jgi:carboxymethylenebutenolidase
VIRREFLWRLAVAAGATPVSMLATTAALEAQIQIPSEFDNSLESISVAFRGGPGMILGYLTQPKDRMPHPGAVLMHDLAGLTTGMRGVARNLATSGYVVVAPDFLSPQGGVASFRSVEADVKKAVTATAAAAIAPQATGAVAFAKSHGAGGDRGMVLMGIGWGGTQALLFAAGRTDIAACVAFYPDPAQTMPVLAKTTAPVLAIFAAEDEQTSALADKFTQAAAASRHMHAVKIYPGVKRGFHDPGEKAAYKPDVAKQAWTEAIAHLDAHTTKARSEA